MRSTIVMAVLEHFPRADKSQAFAGLGRRLGMA
jgi:hypothetical protein